MGERGFEELVGRELKRLTTEIPPDDLAIQRNVCYEVLGIEGVLAWTADGARERFTGPVARLTRQIPGDVLVGYHFCYGTFPEWPMYCGFGRQPGADGLETMREHRRVAGSVSGLSGSR